MNIQMEFISESELADESFSIVIDGLKPREIYRVEMFLSDYYCINAPMFLAHDGLWKSTATFVSDKNGIIDISQTPSCSGSYEGISTYVYALIEIENGKILKVDYEDIQFK